MKRISREFLVSLVLLIAAALLLRSMSHGEAVPIRKSFAEFPTSLGPWRGVEVGLDARVLEKLQVSDYLFRQYSEVQGPVIGLYVGYYQSQREGATYHSPKNCLPGSGWYFAETGTTRLGVTDERGRPVEVNRFVIQKGTNKQLVFYWYQDRGRILTSEYWAKIYMVLDAMLMNRTDGAFVRITVPFTDEGREEAFAQGKAFVEAVFPVLQAYLPG